MDLNFDIEKNTEVFTAFITPCGGDGYQKQRKQYF